MNKVILSGIDFSDCSINALEHALIIAAKAEADLTMVWVNRPVSGKEIYQINQENIVSEVIKRFDALIEKYQPNLPAGKLNYVIRKGRVYREIVDVANELDAFLIVVGTHGASGFEEFWIGSNANRIIAATHRPVISIRGGVFIHKDLQKIVMPIDSTVESRQKVPMTTLLAKYFNAEIHVLAMFTSPFESVRSMIREYVAQTERYLLENGIKHYVEHVETDNITNATIDYAIKIDANLISIMDEQESAAANLWLGPYAQQMINHSPIPVLCIHARDFIAGANT